MLSLMLSPSILLGKKKEGWTTYAKIVGTVTVMAFDALMIIAIIKL